MRPGAAFVPFALIAAVLLTACTNSTSGHPGDPAASTDPVVSLTPTAPTTTSTSTPPAPVGTEVPADVPTTGPNLLHKGERPPVMPALATEHTPAGAVAFAKFFIQTIDWGYATTSTAYMRHYYVSGCITCESIQKAIDRQAGKDRHFVGDRLSIDSAISSGLYDQTTATVTAKFAISSVEVVDRHGVFVDASPAMTLRNQVTLHWSRDRWIVIDLLAQR